MREGPRRQAALGPAVIVERIAAYDAGANDLLSRVDALGTVDPSAEPDCAKLQELAAVSLELQATVKAKAAYTLAKLDQMLKGPPAASAAEPKKEPKPKSAEAPKALPPSPPAPKAPARPTQESSCEARTKGEPSREVAIAPPPPPPAQSAPQPLPPAVAAPDEEG